MTEGSRKWLKGCGCGCLVALALATVALLGSSVIMMRPFRDAIEVREILDARHGEQADFIPSLDGAVDGDRMKTFLAVRRELMKSCDEFAEAYGSFDRMERFDGVEDPPKGEILREMFAATKGAIGLGPLMGHFFHARNEALLAAGMGLGEYTYIYVLAYADRLRSTRMRDGQEFESTGVSARVRGALANMLRNQLAALEADIGAMDAGPDSADGAARSRDSVLAILKAEIHALEDDPERVLWSDGLPPAIATSLAPFREQLDQLFCTHTTDLELTRNRKRFIGIQGD